MAGLSLSRLITRLVASVLSPSLFASSMKGSALTRLSGQRYSIPSSLRSPPEPAWGCRSVERSPIFTVQGWRSFRRSVIDGGTIAEVEFPCLPPESRRSMISISLYLVACLVLGLGLLVWHARPGEYGTNRLIRRVRFPDCAIWVLGVAFFHSGTTLRFWAPASIRGGQSHSRSAFLTFVRYYPTPTKWPARWILRLTFVARSPPRCALADDAIDSDRCELTASGPTRESGPLYPLFAAYFIVAWFTALTVFIVKVDARSRPGAFPTPISRSRVRRWRPRRDH